MIRTIIHIDPEKCNGCGACVTACHEGAIGLRNGKAVLLRDDYCDGLGNCLPVCPTAAISFEEREALAYDEEAVQATMQKRHDGPLPWACPGSMARALPVVQGNTLDALQNTEKSAEPSCLRQWPVQLRLVSPNAVFLAQAKLLVAADCAAYAYASFHQDFMAGAVTLIGCPKLDAVDYAEKLAAIVANNEIASITVVKMSVPCCQELAGATMRAIQKSGKTLDLKVVTITPEGNILSYAADENHQR